ncbi:MAG: hypothetical protein AAFY08_12465 [Planctomycetota bacterium]
MDRMDAWTNPFAPADDRSPLSAWQRIASPLLGLLHLLIVAPGFGLVSQALLGLILQNFWSPNPIFPYTFLGMFAMLFLSIMTLFFTYITFLSSINGMTYLLATVLGRRLRARAKRDDSKAVPPETLATA